MGAEIKRCSDSEELGGLAYLVLKYLQWFSAGRRRAITKEIRVLFEGITAFLWNAGDCSQAAGGVGIFPASVSVGITTPYIVMICAVSDCPINHDMYKFFLCCFGGLEYLFPVSGVPANGRRERGRTPSSSHLSQRRLQQRRRPRRDGPAASVMQSATRGHRIRHCPLSAVIPVESY